MDLRGGDANGIGQCTASTWKVFCGLLPAKLTYTFGAEDEENNACEIQWAKKPWSFQQKWKDAIPQPESYPAADDGPRPGGRPGLLPGGKGADVEAQLIAAQMEAFQNGGDITAVAAIVREQERLNETAAAAFHGPELQLELEPEREEDPEAPPVADYPGDAGNADSDEDGKRQGMMGSEKAIGQLTGSLAPSPPRPVRPAVGSPAEEAEGDEDEAAAARP